MAERLARRLFPEPSLWLSSFGHLAVGEVITSALRFAALIWVTRRLGPSQFATVSVGLAIGTYLAVFAHSGLETIGTRELARRPERATTTLGEVVAARLLLASAFYATALIVAFLLPIGGPIRLVVLGFALATFTSAGDVRWAFVGIQQTRPVAVASAIAAVVYLTGVVIGVRGHEDLFVVPVVSITSEAVLVAALVVASTRRFGRWRPYLTRDRLGPALSASFPITLVRGSRTMMISLDVVLATWLLPDVMAGQYAAASRITAVGIVYLGLYYNAFFPSVVRAQRTPDELQALVKRAVRQVLWLGPPLAVAAVAAAPPVIRLVLGPGYGGTIVLLQVLIVSLLLLPLTNVYSSVLLAADRQRRLAQITGGSLALLIAANLLLLPTVGAIGASLATVAAEAARLALIYLAARSSLASLPDPASTLQR